MKYGSNPIVLWDMKIVEATGEKLYFISFSFYFCIEGTINKILYLEAGTVFEKIIERIEIMISQINEIKAESVIKDAMIEDLEKKLADAEGLLQIADAEIEKLNNIIAAKDDKIAELEDQVLDAYEIPMLETAVHKLEDAFMKPIN